MSNKPNPPENPPKKKQPSSGTSSKRQKKRIGNLFDNLEAERIPPEIASPGRGIEKPDLPDSRSDPPAAAQEEAQSTQKTPVTGQKVGSDSAPSMQSYRLSSAKSLGYQAIMPESSAHKGEPDVPPSGGEPGEDQVIPATSILTPIGWDSIKQSHLVVQNTDPEQPAAVAYALPFGGIQTSDQSVDDQQTATAEQTALLLEIMDDDRDREWSEDEMVLLEQVTDQLSLALENARLFDEARTRSEQLAILNDMSRALSTQLNSDDVIETIYQYASRLVDTQNCILALYLSDDERVSFPLVYEANRRMQWESRPISNALTDQIIKTQQPVLIKSGFGESPFADTTQREPLSWLGVPMIYGEQVIGVIAVQSYQQENHYDENDRDLLNAVASQAAVALLNARLFEQTQTALGALEVSERYQKSVAQAVALLTERGMGALSDVLEILGTAAQASRAYYFETQVDPRGAYWRLMAEWHVPDVKSQLSNPILRRLSTKTIEPWLDSLRAKEAIAATISRLPDETKEFFTQFGTRSILQFAVAGRHEIPGCIGFEQNDHERSWGEDEIAALQTAASALANTIVREDLFTQVQINLAETEGLYQASARLNSAVGYEDILEVLRQHTILGHINTSNITINVFDKPWEYRSADERGSPPEWLIPMARWTAKQQLPPDSLQEATISADRYPLSAWPTIDKLLQPERPTVVMNVASDPRIDDVGRSIYQDRMGAKSLVYVPLNVAGRWIGQIIGVYRQTTGFPEGELRRLMSLSGQAAVAVQNLQSIDLATQRAQEAQQRSEELATLNQITAAASRSLDLDEVLTEIIERVLTTVSFDGGLISIVNISTQKLELAVHQNLPKDMVTGLKRSGMEGSACELVHQSKKTIAISDIGNIATLNPEWLEWQDIFNGPAALGFQAYFGIPLESRGEVLGTICLFNRTIKEITPGQISILQAVGQQLGVVIENARLFQEARRRANQLQTAAEIARDTSSTLALDTLLQRTVNQLRERFDYYHATIFLLDESERYAVVRESTGKAGEEMKRRGHTLPVGGPSVIGQTTLTGEPLVVNDITTEEAKKIHRPNPMLPETRAELGIPLMIGERVIGALDVKATTSDAFTEDDITILQTLSDQIAVAVDNARSYELAQKAMEEIREADRLKSQFLANMSHELRTPLNSIIGFSRVILKGIDGPINELQQQDLSAIYNSGQHLLGLINDVLDLSKIEAGKMELAFDDNVNLGDIIKGVMSTTVGLVKDKPIQLQQDINLDIPLLRIDPMKIRQVLLNLLSNAAKFTEEGTITAKADIQAGPKGQPEIFVGVIDSGPGIAPEDQKKLFQPFSQVDGSLTRKTGGSGLGLSICHHLIRLHGGRIGLKSKIGEGSTFYFTLPIGLSDDQLPAYEFGYQPELPDLEPPKDGQTGQSATPPGKELEEPVLQKAKVELSEPGDIAPPAKSVPAVDPQPEFDAGPPSTDAQLAEPPTQAATLPNPEDPMPASVSHGLVLAIDKDPQVIELYRRYLSDHGFTVIAVTEIDQAITVAQGIHPTVITLDISMQSEIETRKGKLDGWYVLKELKKHPSTKKIPVIICSILDEKDKAMEMGADEYLTKPILEMDLSLAIQRLNVK